MLRSCLVLLACYALLFAGYVWWLGQMFDPRGLYIGAGIAALVTGGCLGSLYNAGVSYREWSLVAAARQGLPWNDGRWTAVAGEIHPVGEPLKAPFSGEECVLCEYDVASQHRLSSAGREEGSKPGSDFSGFLMNACVVRGDAGEMRLLGFPNLVGFGERVCKSAEAAANARDFFLGTQFEDYSGLKMVTVFSAIKAAWSDDDGLVRKNIRLGKELPEALFPDEPGPAAMTLPAGGDILPTDAANQQPAEDVEDPEEATQDDDDDEDLDLDDASGAHYRSMIPLLKEKRVKVGDKVCAIGIYSGQRGGLVPGGLGADHFIKLIRGRASDIEQSARGLAYGRFFGGLIGLIVVNAVAFGVMAASRHHPKQREERRREAFSIVESQQPDFARLEKLFARGLDVNARDSSGRTLLGVAASRSPEAARWLIDHGAKANEGPGADAPP